MHYSLRLVTVETLYKFNICLYAFPINPSAVQIDLSNQSSSLFILNQFIYVFISNYFILKVNTNQGRICQFSSQSELTVVFQLDFHVITNCATVTLAV